MTEIEKILNEAYARCRVVAESYAEGASDEGFRAANEIAREIREMQSELEPVQKVLPRDAGMRISSFSRMQQILAEMPQELKDDAVITFNNELDAVLPPPVVAGGDSIRLPKPFTFTSDRPAAAIANPTLSTRRTIVVVDDFLSDPDRWRETALKQDYKGSEWYKGLRTEKQYLSDAMKFAFEELLGCKITEWESHGMNGRFFLCPSETPLVIHSDMQSHAASLYLTPNAPPEAGTTFYRSRVTGKRRAPDDKAEAGRQYDGNLFDKTKWDVVDVVGNVYNRLVIWDARLVHSASCFFGNTVEDARLSQIFFFGCE